MAITNAFREAVASGDVTGVRIMMTNSLLADPTFQEFEDMARLAGKMPGLYDAHDGRELSEDQSAWNDDYMNRLTVEIVDNFSYERIAHLKRVVKRLHPAPKAQPYASRHETGGQHRTDRQTEYQKYQKQKDEDDKAGRVIRTVGITAGGAAIGGTCGALLVGGGGAVLSGAIIGAAIGAGVSAAI